VWWRWRWRWRGFESAGWRRHPTGDGGNTSNPSDNSWLQLTPSSAAVTQYVGESQYVEIVAKSSKTISQTINVGIIDSAGVLTTDVRLTAYSQYEYHAGLNTAPTLAPGTHASKIEIRLCEDNPVTCAKPVPGSPWFVPVSVKVLPMTNLKPLTQPAQPRPWSTTGGNAAHAGFIPENFDVANFSRRWTWQPADTYIGGDLGYESEAEPVIENGQVFLVTSPHTFATERDWTLRAISEETGTETWKTTLGTVGSVFPPAAANGKIYLTSFRYADGYHMYFWTFDQKTGALLGKRDIYSPDWTSATSTQGGFYKADSATGAEVWMNVVKGMQGVWTPAVDGKYMYIGEGGTSVSAYQITDGKEAFVINGHRAVGTQLLTTPMLDDRGHLFVTEGTGGPYKTLRTFDLATRSLVWQQEGITSRPVTANGLVYFMQKEEVVAVDGMTGAKRWSTKVSGTFDDPSLVLANNVLFISDSRGNSTLTVGVDLSSHQQVWTFRATGKLAVSDRGVLYLSRRNGNGLIAVNLK
jgi:hypothetical protein